MAGGGTAPPPEAVRKEGVGAIFVITIAIVILVAGLGLGLAYSRSLPKTVLLVATNAPFPPFEDFNATNGEFEGFDIDIAALIAQELGRTLRVVQFSSFQVLLATVGTGGVDMAASAITSSGSQGATRNQTMDFSNPYYNANQAVLVRTASTLTCASNTCTAASLAGLEVGVQQGTTSEGWVNDNGDPSTVITTFVTVDSELAALSAGSIDAIVIDLAPAQTFAGASGGTLRVAGQIITNELYSFAVPNNDPDNILPAINQFLAEIMADGRYDALIAKWFG